MEPDENDTPLESGTENVNPEDDTADLSTYWDPDDDQDTSEAETEDATDEGAEESETEEAEPEQPAMVTLADGTQVTLDEAIKGYQRQADYSRKTLETAELRKALDADLKIVSGITEAFIDHLTKLVPPMPDAALAMRDPSAYIRQKAQHDTAMAQVQQLVELGKKPKEIGEKLSEADKKALMVEQNALLAARFPVVATPEGRAKFFEGAATAAESLGFTIDELKGVSDHRMFALAHWANEGLKAARAREAAKAKVANVPPATPRKPGQPVQQGRNKDAMRKLTQSGSIRDAMKVDWE